MVNKCTDSKFAGKLFFVNSRVLGVKRRNTVIVAGIKKLMPDLSFTGGKCCNLSENVQDKWLVSGYK